MRRSALAVLLAVLAAPAAAHAAPDWTPAQDLTPPDAGIAGVPLVGDLGIDAAQRRTTTELRLLSNPPLRTAARILSRAPGEAPVVEYEAIGDATTTPYESRVAVGADGAAVACLDVRLGPDFATAVRRNVVLFREAGARSWQTGPVVDDVESDNLSDPCVPAIGADGTMAAAIRRDTQATPPEGRVQLTFRRPGGTWRAPVQVSTGDRNAFGQEVAVEDDGDLTVVWAEDFTGVYPNARATIKAKRYTAANDVLGATTDLAGTGSGDDANAPELAMDGEGRAIVAFQWKDDVSGYVSTVATRDSGAGSWAPALQLPTTSGSTNGTHAGVGVGPDGSMVAASYRSLGSSSTNRTFVTRRAPGGAWQAEQPLTPPGSDLPSIRGVVYLGADPVIINDSSQWGIGPVLQAIRWRAGSSTPDAPRDLFTPGTSASLGRALPDRQGGMAVVFDVGGSTTPTKVTAFDASPPVLRSLAVPGAVTAGVAAPLGATFADLWSPVGDVSWAFGDGTTGSGASTSHAWPAGTYGVAASAADVLGNAATANASVTATAATGGPAPAPPGPTPPAADRTAPTVTLTQPACRRGLSKARCTALRKRTTSWRTLRGTARDTGGAGVAKVEVAVSRRSGSRTLVLKGTRFVRGATTYRRATRSGTSWTLKLPKLARGTYVVRVRATDGAGNASKVLTRTLGLR